MPTNNDISQQRHEQLVSHKFTPATAADAADGHVRSPRGPLVNHATSPPLLSTELRKRVCAWLGVGHFLLSDAAWDVCSVGQHNGTESGETPNHSQTISLSPAPPPLLARTHVPVARRSLGRALHVSFLNE